MKRLMLIASLLALIFTTSIFAQRNKNHGELGNRSGRIEQLEKIKIIEELDFDEETAIKFFARRNKHRESQRELVEKRKLFYNDLAEKINSEDENKLKAKLDEVFQIEIEMLNNRKEFLYSLNDFLTEKEIAKLVLFEFNFRNEMRHQFMKQGKRRMQRK